MSRLERVGEFFLIPLIFLGGLGLAAYLAMGLLIDWRERRRQSRRP